MKTIILVLLISISSTSYARILHSTGNGLWTSSTTWGGVGTPSGGDTVMINLGDVVDISGTITVSGSALDVQVSGTLHFYHKGVLHLPAGTIITLSSSTNITSANNNHQQLITVGGSTVWQADQGIIDSNTIIVDSTLPIELIDYRIKENTFLFTTASQENVERFVIELYDENMNNIGELYEMPCNCLMVMEYVHMMTIARQFPI